MQANIIQTRDLYESYLHRATDGTTGISNPGLARKKFLDHFRHGLGLCDKNGKNYTDRVGNRILRESPDESLRIYPERFSIKEMMESIVGPGLSSFLQDPQTFVNWREKNYAIEQRFPNDPRALLEAGAGVSPSAFADINAWTAANSGLLERRVLEQFDNPEHIGGILAPDEQTRIMEGQKIIGVANIAALPGERFPNQPHPRATMQERYVTLPRLQDWALAIDISFEAAFFDLTGQVLENAENVGKRVKLAKELRIIDAVIGVNASTGANTGRNAFTYKGTPYAQFASAEALPVPKNSITNSLVNGDWQTIKAGWLLAKRMRDPETGTRINVNTDTILTGLDGSLTANLITGAGDVQRRTAGSSTQSTANTLTVQNTANNPAAIGGPLGIKRVLTSSLMEQRMLDSDGLGLTADQAAGLWFLMEAGKSHRNMVAIPLTVTQMPMASSYDMVDKKIIQTTFVDEMSTPSVWSIWHIIRNLYS